VIYLPFPRDLAFAFKLGGFFFLAVGATAAMLALLREEDAAQGHDFHDRSATNA